jgi:acyl-CoA synthetase (AMP-forming)/AMP-acid ligase II
MTKAMSLPPAKSASFGTKARSSCAAIGKIPKATAETFIDGWIKTGDLAKIDEEGFIYIVDRAKDMLIRGGENIYCVEVENALYDHPAVMDAAVIGKPHVQLGEEPLAVVHLKPGAKATSDELRHHVRAKDRRVQSAGRSDLLARDAAAQRQRQDHEERPEESSWRVPARAPRRPPRWRLGVQARRHVVEHLSQPRRRL